MLQREATAPSSVHRAVGGHYFGAQAGSCRHLHVDWEHPSSTRSHPRSEHEPRTSSSYVDRGRYTGGRFHRTVTPANQPDKKVKIEVIQAGVNPKHEKDDFPPIKLERTNGTGIHHKDGTISMARDGADTATSDFFICIGNQPQLTSVGKRNPDGQGFAAFGRSSREWMSSERSKPARRRSRLWQPQRGRPRSGGLGNSYRRGSHS